jgi:outer membrane protein assembly factor BamB
MTVAGALVRLIIILIVAAALPCRAEDVISGRWEGTAQIPDGELIVVIDLAQENGAWVGSITNPGLGLKGTPLTTSRRNAPFLYHSNWREAPLVANDQQIRTGGIYSSPIVVNGVVYFGSADGFVYALE